VPTTPRDWTLSIDGGPTWIIVFAFGMWHNLRLGGAIRGKQRMLDGKDKSGLFLCLELRRW
jgi:hypothetical protein